MYPEFKNTVVVVTGSGAGIGKAIALRFSREGAILVINDLLPEKGKKVANEIESKGGQAIAIAGDMTKESDVNYLFDKAIGIFNRIDVLVNNVGLFEFSGDLVGSSKEYWDKLFDINVNSAFLCANRAAQEMKKAGSGRIINISSAAGKVGSPGERGYSAAKWAILGLTKTLALELAPEIRVNAVCPGYIDTAMSDVWLEKIAEKKGISTEEAKKQRLAPIPLGGVGTPEEVASAVVFLASNEASYTTGEGFNVSGGRVMN